MEHIPSTSTVPSDTRSVADESSSKRKEAEKFEFEPWPQASNFGSTEKCYQDQLILDLRLVSRICCRSKFEKSRSEDRQGIMKIIPADLKRKINFLEETQYKSKCPMLTGRQILFQIFSFSNINKTQGHTMNLSYLLNVELYTDNLKVFNQPWEETLLAL